MAITDFHCHVVPGVDDGAQTVEEARTALRVMQESGVAAVVATPHFQGSLTRRVRDLGPRLAELDAGWRRLTEEAAAGLEGLALHRGVELALDVPDPDLSDPRLRLAGGSFVLVEFPYMTVPPNSAGVFAGLRARGWAPILAHPERYIGTDPNLEIARAWRKAGAHLQVNAGSVLGRYGADAQRRALRLLEQGWVDFIASDFHARGRMSLAGCRQYLIEHGGEEHARLLLEANPARILAGEPPLPLSPLRIRGGIWARVARLTKVFR